MDAFSVSLANGLNRQNVKGKMLAVEAETVKSLLPPCFLFRAWRASIDALSVGFAFAEYNFYNRSDGVAAYRSRYLRAMYGGLCIGKKAGMKLADKATIVGGIILIAIGIEIFLSNIL